MSGLNSCVGQILFDNSRVDQVRRTETWTRIDARIYVTWESPLSRVTTPTLFSTLPDSELSAVSLSMLYVLLGLSSFISSFWWLWRECIAKSSNVTWPMTGFCQIVEYESVSQYKIADVTTRPPNLRNSLLSLIALDLIKSRTFQHSICLPNSQRSSMSLMLQDVCVTLPNITLLINECTNLFQHHGKGMQTYLSFWAAKFFNWLIQKRKSGTR